MTLNIEYLYRFPGCGDDCNERMEEAVTMILENGQTHCQAWVIDKVLRILLQNAPEVLIAYKAGKDGPDTYYWDEGTAP